MSDSCLNAIECCDPVFPVEASNIMASLSGLVWKIPCLSKAPPYSVFACQTNDPANQVAELTGNFNQLYLVTMLLRGVIEYEKYSGGVVVSGSGGRMIAGGTPELLGHNIYVLTVSNPAQTYYLNQWDGDAVHYGECHVVRYTVSLQMRTGATVTLSATCQDGQEATNLNGLVITPLPGEPPINPTIIQTPFFDGQFLQCDVITVQ